MLEQMVGFFVSWFGNPSLWGIGLAVAFGAVWLACYWPSLFKKPWLWAVLIGSAALTWVAVTFIQMALQTWVGQALNQAWSQEVIMRWLPLAGIPVVLISGLVQEGSKLVPVVVYWWRRGRNIDPKLGLVIGAIAGVGFGIFEAQWAHNLLFASGWSWGAVQTGGLTELVPFWERFFSVAFHTAISALAGYGLAKGWGWQFYLIASFVHAILNYSIVLWQSGVMTLIQLEIFIAVVALVVTVIALWLRWRKMEAMAEV